MKAPRRVPRRPAGVGSPGEAVGQLLGRGAIYTITTVLQLSSGFLVVLVLTRMLAPREYGEVAAALVVFTTTSVIAGVGLPEGIPRALFDGPDGPLDARRLVAATVLLALGISALAEVSGALWAPVLSLKYDGLLRTAVWGGAVAAVMFAGQAVLRAADQVAAFVGVTLVGTVFAQLLGLLGAAIWGTADAYIGGLVAGTGVAAVLGLALSGGHRHGMPSKRVLVRSLKFGSALIPNSFSLYLVGSADRVVIIALLGLAAAGRYQVAYAIGSLGVALATAVNAAWMPMLLAVDEKDRWEILAATSRVVHWFGALVSSGLAMGAPLILSLAAPASYRPGQLVAVSAVVAPSALVYMTSSTYFAVLFLVGRTGAMVIAAPLAALANIGLNMILLPTIGLIGASLATVAAYAVLAVIMWRAARPHAVLRDDGHTVLITAAFTAPIVVAGALLPPGAWGTVTRALVVAVCILAFLRLARDAREQRRAALGIARDASAASGKA